jgi:hypothetical protein
MVPRKHFNAWTPSARCRQQQAVKSAPMKFSSAMVDIAVEILLRVAESRGSQAHRNRGAVSESLSCRHHLS